MIEQDVCQRFLFDAQDIKGELVRITSSYQDILAKKRYPPVIESLLGEFLVASVLLSSTIKFDGRLILQARSEGSVSLIMAECDSKQRIRGIVRHRENLEASNFQELLNNGTLAITIEPLKGDAYQGIVPMESSDLAGCLQDYFLRSEQLATRFNLVATPQQCAGMLLQQLPAQLNKDPESRSDTWQTISQLAATLQSDELHSLGFNQLLYRLFNQQTVKLFEGRPVSHHCSCSSERTARALIAIGQDEVMAIVAEQGQVEINCEFCGMQYLFQKPELELLFENRSDDLVH